MVRGICVAIALGVLAGNGRVALAASPAPATAALSQGGTFIDKKSGIQISWPDGWKQEQSKDYNVLLTPDPAPQSPERWMSLDIPDLPLHVPDMIPIGRVESGYLDDLQKQFGHLDVQNLTPPAISDAKLRLVRAAWNQDGQSMQQTALLIVHGDHVYIVRLRSDVDKEADLRRGFDSFCGSIKWVK